VSLIILMPLVGGEAGGGGEFDWRSEVGIIQDP
jgi:hypothetical protein